METAIKITGTFLDEISHDIPAQNWGPAEWDRDFAAMKAVGINTVILIRSGYKQWMTYPSSILEKHENCLKPSTDLVKMFLELSEKYEMAFYFGTYDSGRYWSNGEYQKEIDLNKRVVEEVWNRYGSSPAFKGWYLTQEVSRNIHGIIDIYASMGRFCKEVAHLPVLISPYIEGVKAVWAFSNDVTRAEGITPARHEKEWNEILCGIKDAVDIIAFQDGHVDFSELADFLKINKVLTDKYGLECWTNSETFDRDMPIKFLPIKWEKLWMKLEAARQAGIEKAITFEFSHFMSPYSCYPQAHGLYRRYCDYKGL